MKNYIDRLKTGTTPEKKLVNLYENRTPTGILYYVTEARQRVFETEMRAAAETYFERRLTGSGDSKTDPEPQ